MELYEYVGERIRDLRKSYGSEEGVSQEVVANAIGVTTNTISRWETATYHPTLDDLDRLARFFGVSILEFLPKEKAEANDKVAALLRTAKQLTKDDLEELKRFAEYRHARSLYSYGVRPRSTRKKKDF